MDCKQIGDTEHNAHWLDRGSKRAKGWSEDPVLVETCHNLGFRGHKCQTMTLTYAESERSDLVLKKKRKENCQTSICYT